MRSWDIISACILICACSCTVVKSSQDLQRLNNQSTTHKILIKKEIDLKGSSVVLPKGSTIVFSNGSINNGQIKFDSNILKGAIKFDNCTYAGTIIAKKIDDRCFTSEDDTGTLKFLLFNAITNGAKCVFHRDYKIDMNATSWSGLLTVEGFDSGADISFQGHTIFNTTSFTKPSIKPVLVFINLKNVTIRDCLFHDTEEHNARNFKKSAGCNFIHCYGDCEGINLLNCCQENGDGILRSGVYTHSTDYSHYTPHRGLTNSTLDVKSINTGYGLALYCGENLDINLDVTSPHRGLYCAGVSFSKIRYRGFDPQETNSHILIKDAVFKKIDNVGRELLDMKGCHDLVIKASIDELQESETVITFQSYGSGKKEGADFTFRSEKCHHYNVDFCADIKRFPENGHFFICNCASESGALGEEDIYGCKLSNITIHDVKLKGSAKKYMCLVSSHTDADILVKDCDVVADKKGMVSGFSIQVNGYACGKVRVVNGIIDNILVNEKESGVFDIEMENAQLLNGVKYQNVQTVKRSFVKIKD